jgi:hypothetical protein
MSNRASLNRTVHDHSVAGSQAISPRTPGSTAGKYSNAGTATAPRHTCGVNRRSLRDLLDVEGVDRRAYRVDGTSLEQALSLGPVDGGWKVWFTERGQQTNLIELETEDEACSYPADRILGSDENRWVLAAGPADPATADRDLDAWLAQMGVSRQDLRASDIRTEDLPWTRSETRRRHWILRSTSRRLPVTVLPDDFVRQIQSMYEFRMGVHRVGLKLTDGREFSDVFVSGERVSWVAGCDTIPFRASTIAKVWNSIEA